MKAGWEATKHIAGVQACPLDVCFFVFLFSSFLSLLLL
jgi:hypothetical protein